MSENYMQFVGEEAAKAMLSVMCERNDEIENAHNRKLVEIRGNLRKLGFFLEWKMIPLAVELLSDIIADLDNEVKP